MTTTYQLLITSTFFLAFLNVRALSRIRDGLSINFREKEKEILDHIIGEDRYDSRIRPSGMINDTSIWEDDSSATIVNVNTYVRAIDKIDDYKMEYSVQITFREDWIDPRLTYNDFNGKLKYLTMTETDRVWMPDTFFQNEKMGHFHNIIVPNVYIRIFPTGKVLYSIRISLTLSCPMDLKLYPLDRQECEMRIASYGWTTDDLIYRWKEQDPVQIVKDLNLPRFKLEKFSTDYCNSKTNTGEYSCLKVQMVFKREFSYYLLTIYVPSCMLVIVSWVSFWLDSKSVPARVALGVTTLLTMSTQTAGVNRSLPPVAYTKAIDVWSGACVIFVFSALLEFAFVNYASRGDRRRGYIGNDYGEDEDEIDYTKQYSKEEDEVILLGRRPHGDRRYKTIGESILLGAAAVATTADHFNKSGTVLLRTNSSSSGQNSNNQLQQQFSGQIAPNPPTRIVTNHFQYPEENAKNIGLAECLENSFDSSLKGNKGKSKLNPSYWLARKFKSRAKRIDVMARIIFPLVWAIFNLSYWTYYLSVQHKSRRSRS